MGNVIQLAGRERRNALRLIAAHAVRVARGEIGCGEFGGNNAGPDVRRYRGGRSGRGPWCAAFVHYCFSQAAADLEFRAPLAYDPGAKSLTRQIAAVGRWVDLDVEGPAPGDVLCWHRGPRIGPLSWRGHVGIVSRAPRRGPHPPLYWIDGNRGPAPSPVTERCEAWAEWTRGLWRIARLA